MKNREVILFTDTYPFGTGEEFLAAEMDFLSGGFRLITVVPLRHGGSSRARPLPANVRVTEPLLPTDSSLYLALKGVFNLSPIAPMLREFFEMAAWQRAQRLRKWLEAASIVRHVLRSHLLRETLAAAGPDALLYFYWASGTAWAAPFMEASLPMVSRFHGFDLYEERKEFAGRIPFRKRLLERVRSAVFISEHGLRYLTGKYPGMDFDGRVFRLGVKRSPPLRTCEDGTFRVASCSRIVPLKRIDLISRALAMVDFPVEWVHFGDGPDRRRIELLARDLPAAVSCRITGWLPNTEVRRQLSEGGFNLFLNVSETEGAPVSLMEALATGIPVMATAVGGTPELIDDSVGTLLPPYVNAENLAGFIADFRNSDSRRASCSTNALARWRERADADRNYPQFVRFLQDL